MQLFNKFLEAVELLAHTIVLMNVLCMQSANTGLMLASLACKVRGTCKLQHIPSFTNLGRHKSCNAGPALGCTLVAGLFGQNRTLVHCQGTQVTKVINQFRQQVDQFLPGMYAWFDDSSLHVTIRALMG